MSPDELPEDLSQWPRNPFQLLGLQPGVTAKDARHAYTRLIRRFKPEQFPEHFRRIREAYEQVQHHGLYYFPTDLPAAPASVPREPPSKQDVPDVPINVPVQLREFRPDEPDDLEKLWERVCQGGQEHDVYQQLLRCQHRLGNQDEVLLRLYWLHRVVPGVDPGRDPCHWLALGLRQNWYGPCRELYRREIEQRPAESVGERFTSLLENTAPLVVLAEWLEWRWSAAGALGQWQVIVRDVAAMRPRFSGHDDFAWARLLLAALDQLAWVTSSGACTVVPQICQELDALTHVHGQLDLSRVDLLMDLVQSWKRLNPKEVPAALRWFIPRSWVRPFPEVRLSLRELLEGLLACPRDSLVMLDRLQKAAPGVVGQLGRMVELFYYTSGFHDDPQSTGRNRVVREFLEETSFLDDYSYFRVIVLDFMLRECLVVDQAVTALTQHTDLIPPAGMVYLYQLREDWPIRILCMAKCAYWA